MIRGWRNLALGPTLLENAAHDLQRRSRWSLSEFDRTLWTLVSVEEDERIWRSETGDVLVLSRLDELPELKTWRNDEAVQRDARTLAASSDAALLLAEREAVDGRVVVRVIYKKQDDSLGYTYTGLRFTSDGGTGCALMTVVAKEGDLAGAREAAVLERLERAGTPVRRDERGRMRGWYVDPYDARLDDRTIATVADADRFDAVVPEHPLTRVRKALISLDPDALD
ncbi:MAG: hypothetical protein R2752_07070 [Vicinamibacterales bacterium]